MRPVAGLLVVLIVLGRRQGLTNAQTLPCPGTDSDAPTARGGYSTVNPDPSDASSDFVIASDAALHQWVGSDENFSACNDTANFAQVLGNGFDFQPLQVCSQEVDDGRMETGDNYGLHFRVKYECWVDASSVANVRLALKAVVFLPADVTSKPQVLSVWRDTDYPVEQRVINYVDLLSPSSATPLLPPHQDYGQDAAAFPCPDPDDHNDHVPAAPGSYMNIDIQSALVIDLDTTLAATSSFDEWVSKKGGFTACNNTAEFSDYDGYYDITILRVCKQDVAVGTNYGLQIFADYFCDVKAKAEVAEDRLVLKAVVFVPRHNPDERPEPQVSSVWRAPEFPLQQEVNDAPPPPPPFPPVGPPAPPDPNRFPFGVLTLPPGAQPRLSEVIAG